MPVPIEYVKMAISVAKALLTGESVGRERLERRLEICATCIKVQFDAEGNMKCGICKCKLKGDESLINLVRYEETKDYGCHFPGGSRWKERGV